MSFLTRLRDYLMAEPRAQRVMLDSRSIGDTIPPWTVGKPRWAERSVTTYDREAYRKVVLAWRCTQYLANGVGAATLRLYDDAREPVEDDHPLRQLLARPNDGMGDKRFLSYVTMVLAVAGFCVIEKERDRAGRVIGLWPLRSDWVRAVPRQNAPPDWEYRVPGYTNPFLLSSDDVIPLTYADTPDGSPLGIGPVEIMLREAQVSSALTDFLKVFMDRGAMPMYAIIPQDEGAGAAQWKKQETKDAFMEAWRQRYGGLRNAAEPLPLVGVKDIKQVGFDFNQLAYPELNNLNDARICTAFGIPPILVGTQVGLEQATYSNYGQARTSFYQDTMTYLWTRLDDAFTRHLLPEFEQRHGWDIHFDTADVPALQDNTNERWSRATSAFAGGLVSRHVAHREMGLDPHGPDEFLVPFNMAPLPNTTSQRGRPTIEMVDVPSRALPEPRIVERDGRRYLNERALSEAEQRAQATVVRVHRAAIMRLAEVLEPHVAGYLDGQKARVIEAVTVQRSQVAPNGTVPETRAVEDIDWWGETEALLEVLRPWAETVGAEAFAEASGLVGMEVAWDVSNPYLAQMHQILGHRVQMITETTRLDIDRVVTEALSEGIAMPELAERLTGLYEETYNGRSMTIARTESQHAYNTASRLAYEASGVVTAVQLHDNPNHTTDPGSDRLTCAQRNALIVPLEDVDRHIAGEHPNGTLAISPVLDIEEGV